MGLPGSVAFASPLQVTELIRALLNAPVSVTLIVAGIAFLAVATVGKIPGRIEPGEQGRKFGLVIGSVLLILGLGIHVGMPVGDGGNPTDGHSTPTPTLAPPTESATSPSVGDGESPTDDLSTPTSTPAPPSPAATDTPTPSLSSFPEGFNESGFTDPNRAVDGHLRAVSLQSFQATLVFRRDGSTLAFDIRADPESRRVHKIWRENGSIQSELFYDAGAVQTRTPGSRGFDGEDAVSYAAATIVEGQFDRFFYSKLSDPEVLRTQGQTAISYIVISERDDHEGDLTVAENGLFINYNLRIELEVGEAFMQYHITNLGETTVEKPEWAD